MPISLYRKPREELCLEVHSKQAQSSIERIECMQNMLQTAEHNTTLDVENDEYADAIAIHIDTLSYHERIAAYEMLTQIDIHSCSADERENIAVIEQVLRNAIVLALCERYMQRLQTERDGFPIIDTTAVAVSVAQARSRYILNPARQTIVY